MRSKRQSPSEVAEYYIRKQQDPLGFEVRLVSDCIGECQLNVIDTYYCIYLYTSKNN